MMFSCLPKTKPTYCSSFKDIGLADFGITMLTDPYELWPLTIAKINVVRTNAFLWCNIWCFYNAPWKKSIPLFFTEHHTINTMMKNSFTLSIAIVQDKWLINSVVSSSDREQEVALVLLIARYHIQSMQTPLTIIAWRKMSSLHWFYHMAVPFVSSTSSIVSCSFLSFWSLSFTECEMLNNNLFSTFIKFFHYITRSWKIFFFFNL